MRGCNLKYYLTLKLTRTSNVNAQIIMNSNYMC